MDFLKKYYTDEEKTVYQGIYILDFAWNIFRFNWFTDCGEWFIYLYWGKRFYRFSSAGNFGGSTG